MLFWCEGGTTDVEGCFTCEVDVRSGVFCVSELLEIALHLDSSAITNLEDFMCSLSKIIITLGGSQTMQWMVTLEITIVIIEPCNIVQP